MTGGGRMNFMFTHPSLFFETKNDNISAKNSLHHSLRYLYNCAKPKTSLSNFD